MAAIRFQLIDKGPPGERKMFAMIPGPVFIRVPEVARAAPGKWMQFTTGINKLLEKSLLGLVRGAWLLSKR